MHMRLTNNVERNELVIMKTRMPGYNKFAELTERANYSFDSTNDAIIRCCIACCSNCAGGRLLFC